jgi:tetratricopeptide (TPR) repeat protein
VRRSRSSRAVGARAEEAHALNTLGCDLAYLGRPDAAVAHLREALRIAEEVRDLDDLCRAYLNLSDLLMGPLNRLEEALALALEGVELSERKGMAGDYGVSLQSNVATALLRLGRLAEAEQMLLVAERRNPSEMAAIDLHQCHAAGRTNREIAAALFITEKTPGAHVSSILSRLGVRSRVEAATPRTGWGWFRSATNSHQRDSISNLQVPARCRMCRPGSSTIRAATSPHAGQRSTRPAPR